LLVAPPAADAGPKQPKTRLAQKKVKKVKRGKKGAAKRKVAVRKGSTPHRLKVSVAPLKGKNAKVGHAPFEMGECNLCHKSNDKKNPGKLNAPVNELCSECHDDMLALQYKHKATAVSCTNCHNPHNGTRKAMLVKEPGKLCLSCHKKIKKLVKAAKVQHGALTEGKKCLNCHNAHSTNVEHLLVELPMNLCISCHSKDTLKDESGRKLTNFKTLLSENPVQHAPVEAGDCSACHRPHGSSNFRLLESEYPPEFYAGWKTDNYAICFQCHEEAAFEKERTTSVTQFRDGKRNLHFLHVNKETRGRTCRACHEVHAAKQQGNVRDGVPYGKKGWVLTLNYKRSKSGGSCEKTCHQKKSYRHTGKPVKAAKTR